MSLLASVQVEYMQASQKVNIYTWKINFDLLNLLIIDCFQPISITYNRTYRGVNFRNSRSVDLSFLKFIQNVVSRGIQNKTYGLTNLLFVLASLQREQVNVTNVWNVNEIQPA